MNQRGMTLLEMTVAVAITVIAATALLAFSGESRVFSGRAAMQQVDAAIAYAQALAASGGEGATMVFSARKASDGAVLDGFVLTLYAGRPTSANALHPAALAPIVSNGAIAESKLGAPPFSVFLNAANHASASHGTVGPGSILPDDPGCPAGETDVTLVFGGLRAKQTRSIACNAVP